LGTLATYCIKFAYPGYIDPATVKMNDLIHWTSLVTARQTAYGFFTLWACLRLMVYLRQLKATAPLIVSIKIMIQKDIFNFLILSALVLMGWSIIMTQLLNGSTFEYRSIPASLNTLLRAGLGSFSYVDTGSGGNSVTENFANIMLALYSLVVLILLINMLIGMMGSTYSSIQDDAVCHWGFSLAQSLLYYELGLWVPPFNIVSEGVKLIVWLFNVLTCGSIINKSGLSDEEYPLTTPFLSRKSNQDILSEDNKFSEVVQKIISPGDNVREWVEITDDGDEEELETPSFPERASTAQKT